ncbi:MAG: hypothetical protein RL660_1253 [Bacteroidota bacterium]|jgi:hypothetical protein
MAKEISCSFKYQRRGTVLSRQHVRYLVTVSIMVAFSNLLYGQKGKGNLQLPIIDSFVGSTKVLQTTPSLDHYEQVFDISSVLNKRYSKRINRTSSIVQNNKLKLMAFSLLITTQLLLLARNKCHF